MKRVGLGMGLLLWFGLIGQTYGAAAVTLAWDLSTDPTVAGYNLYYGPGVRTYTNMVSAGAATSATVSSLAPNVAFYFAVTAVTATGLESDYSVELPYWTPPTPVPPHLNLRATAEGVYAGKRVVLAIFAVPLTAPQQFFRLRVSGHAIWLEGSAAPNGPWAACDVWNNVMATLGENWELGLADDYEVLL